MRDTQLAFHIAPKPVPVIGVICDEESMFGALATIAACDISRYGRVVVRNGFMRIPSCTNFQTRWAVYNYR